MNATEPLPVPEPVRLVSLNEVARLAGVNQMTLRRAYHRSVLRPDALLCGGTNTDPVPLFVEPRVAEIQRLVTKKTK